MAEEEVKESICKDCGLCCDGTLFQYTDISGEDASKWDKLKTVDLDGKTGIQLPCSYLDGCSCTVYDDKPAMCTKYKCKVLRRYEHGVMKAKDAKTIINRTKHLKDVFEGEYNEHYVYDGSLSLAENIQRLTEIVGGPAEFKEFCKDHEDFGFALSDLRKIIRNQYRAQKQNQGGKGANQ